MSVVRVATHTLYPGVLTPESVVVDLGANFGAFAHEVIGRFGCRCHAVEPAPEAFAKIPEHARLSKHNLAVCATAGMLPLHLTDDPQASSLVRLDGHEYTRSVLVRGVSFPEFLREQEIGQVDLLKMDIEGAEVGVFDSCPDHLLERIGQVTVEFHEWAPASGVRCEDVQRIMSRMRRIGFYVYKTHPTSFYDVLFLNRRVVPRWRYFRSVWLPRALRYAKRKLVPARPPGGRA